MEHFDALIFVALEGYRDHANGRAGFRAACVRCHRFGAEGKRESPDLTQKATTSEPRTLLAAILERRSPTDHGSLLRDFSEEDVLDLLAYLLSGGDASDAMFAK